MPYLHTKLGGWGGTGTTFIEPQAMVEYERCFLLPGTVHSMCEDYRASAGIDLENDRASRALPNGAGRIACNTLVLWGERGVVNRLFDPLSLWQAQCAETVTGVAMAAGHFIPEELPRAHCAPFEGFFHG